MLYQKLVIDNFLCFDHFEMQFAPGVSIIIGRNGAGKTSLIRAMVPMTVQWATIIFLQETLT